jgi:Domain of unknown function (DUF4328)
MEGMGRDVGWVCGNCRAINDRRSSRCYSCRAPRALAVDPRSGISPIQAGAHTPPSELASTARKAGATYSSTALRATVVVASIIVVTGLHLSRLGPVTGMFAIAQRWDAREFTAANDRAFNALAGTEAALTLVELIAWAFAFIAWGAWLSRVVANVPALGGGWTRTSPREAFFSSIIPIYNLFWMPAAVRDAVARLSAPGTARDGLVSAWWLALVSAVLPLLRLLPGAGFRVRFAFQVGEFLLFVLFLVATRIPFTLTLVYVALVYVIFLLPAALLAIALVRHIEKLQSARVAALRSGALSAEATTAPPVAAITVAAMAEPPNPVRAPGVPPLSEPSRRDEQDPFPGLVDLGPHSPEVGEFIESLGMMNRDEASRVHRQGLASGAGGGARWASVDRQLDAAAATSGLGSARVEAQRRAERASARSDARVGNRFVIEDECAGVWAAVLVLRDHLDRATAAMAFEPWENVLVAPDWL